MSENYPFFSEPSDTPIIPPYQVVHVPDIERLYSYVPQLKSRKIQDLPQIFDGYGVDMAADVIERAIDASPDPIHVRHKALGETVMSILRKLPDEALEIHWLRDHPDRDNLREVQALNISLTRRKATASERHDYNAGQQILHEKAPGYSREQRVGSEFADLLDKHHLYVVVNNNPYVLPLGDPTSIIAARTLLYIQRRHTVAKAAEISTADTAKQVLEDLSEDERAITLTRDWQLSGTSKKNPIQGMVERILRQVGAGIGIAVSGGKLDYRITTYPVEITVHTTAPAATSLARTMLSPDTNEELSAAQDDIALASQLLSDIRTRNRPKPEIAIRYLSLVMDTPGKDAFILAQRGAVEISVLEARDYIRGILGSEGYLRAHEDRIISGNTTTGDRHSIVRLSGGLMPERSKQTYGDRRHWRFV